MLLGISLNRNLGLAFEISFDLVVLVDWVRIGFPFLIVEKFDLFVQSLDNVGVIDVNMDGIVF